VLPSLTCAPVMKKRVAFPVGSWDALENAVNGWRFALVDSNTQRALALGNADRSPS
jgi:hypothetical protein